MKKLPPNEPQTMCNILTYLTQLVCLLILDSWDVLQEGCVEMVRLLLNSVVEHTMRDVTTALQKQQQDKQASV